MKNDRADLFHVLSWSFIFSWLLLEFTGVLVAGRYSMAGGVLIFSSPCLLCVGLIFTELRKHEQRRMMNIPGGIQGNLSDPSGMQIPPRSNSIVQGRAIPDIIAVEIPFLKPSLWTDPAYLTLVKEFYETNNNRELPSVTVNVGVHVFPNLGRVTGEIFVLFEIVGGVLTPHLFPRREPLPTLPNMMLIAGQDDDFCSVEKAANVKVGYFTSMLDPRSRNFFTGIFLRTLHHTAKRMAEGFKGFLNPEEVVKDMATSKFAEHTNSVEDILGFIDGRKPALMSFEKPDILADILRGHDCKEPSFPRELNYGMPPERFHREFVDRVKKAEIFPIDMTFHDFMLISQDMAQAMAVSAGLEQKCDYGTVKTLIRAGMLLPKSPAPHLSIIGKKLRDILLDLGLMQLKSFYGNLDQPQELGLMPSDPRMSLEHVMRLEYRP